MPKLARDGPQERLVEPLGLSGERERMACRWLLGEHVDRGERDGGRHWRRSGSSCTEHCVQGCDAVLA
jgi:hypothetical protein